MLAASNRMHVLHMQASSSHQEASACATSMESGSDWQQQQSDAEPDSSSSSLGSEDQEESETEYQQRSRSLKAARRVARAGAADTPAAAAAGASSAQGLHAPYSNLLWCESAVERSRCKVTASLCTDIAGVNSSSGSGTAAVQATVEVHAASWDVRQYIFSQLQQQAPAGQQQQRQQGQPPAAQAGGAAGGSHEDFWPYAATLTKYKSSPQFFVTQLQDQHEPQTYLQHLAGKPHRVVLQERVSARSGFNTSFASI